MSKRMSDERLTEYEQLIKGWCPSSDPDDVCVELLQALKAERQEVEKLSNGYACPVCGGYPGPQDNCACGGSGHIADAYDYLRKDHIRLEQEVERLRSEVREWICADCDTVYPGPPTEGFDCVQCPKCKGPTAPRLRVEVERLRLQIERHESAIAAYRTDRDTAERKLARVLEPTEEMIDAGRKALRDHIRDLEDRILLAKRLNYANYPGFVNPALNGEDIPQDVLEYTDRICMEEGY